MSYLTRNEEVDQGLCSLGSHAIWCHKTLRRSIRSLPDTPLPNMRRQPSLVVRHVRHLLVSRSVADLAATVLWSLL